MPEDEISQYRRFKVRGKSKKFRLQAIEKNAFDAGWWRESFKMEDSKVKVRTVKAKGRVEVYTYFDKDKPKRKPSRRKSTVSKKRKGRK